MKIDINVDMGESFGRYILGDDESLMPYVTSANIATGFHAGDPLVLERTIKWSKQYGVAVGAHLGCRTDKGLVDDKWTFHPRNCDPILCINWELWMLS